ncbi:helix-turn-helix transcriptional regulator [Nonomuraea sp. MCN248]|uniref:Helix-turn-helix transcriptional regulator n=1 Tax=Nonomuraea corallina TaxID=2989783 RepID=A0ABT4SNJ8_9ACTN|nr:helix-turn-helix transcriptional regulator [Nonomuraea corallina]MDA0638595.1 helix-turn-helix transcriptional regulator [Nonomuraea corallina]
MYVEWSPPPALSGRIACLWRHVSEDDRPQLVVPDGCVDLIWGPSGPFVAGPDTGPVPTRMERGDTFTGIRFRPGAVGEVFGVPVPELRDQRVPLPVLDVFPALLTAQIATGGDLCGDSPDLMRVLIAAVADRLRRTPPSDPAAPAVAAALARGRGVREVAWELGLSERQLHRRSVASFGYAPKTLQRIVRFQRALRLARSGVPLADVAATAGYTDQAHLSHDVKRLSGVTLSRLVA